MPTAHSVSIGLWVPVGSRDEASDTLGATHFLEHLLFKGTKTLTAVDIAESFDRVGGEANALTAKEYTCYHARLLARDLPMAVRVLTEMLTRAALAQADFETERSVILEELAMAADDPVDVAGEAFAAAVFGDSPLARPIGGTPETIKAQSRDGVEAYYRRHYRPDNLVGTVAGAVEHAGLISLLEAGLDAGGWSLAAKGAASPAPRRADGQGREPESGEGRRAIARPTEQAHVILGCPGLMVNDPRRYVLAALGTVLGGGMSSRLFQEIRERRGLAYSTYALTELHSDAGAFGLYAGCAPAAVDQVSELMASIWADLAKNGPRQGELERAKGQISGGTVLALEDPQARMNRLGLAETVTGRWLTVEEVLAKIDAVTVDQVRELAQELAARPRQHVIVTPA
ncbi:MAG: insulinase family protein [Micrococcales bacterium]|nr:insulinase family protein [Micrococcales bacterium]